MPSDHEETVTISKREYDLLIQYLGGPVKVDWLMLGQIVLDTSADLNITNLNPDQLLTRIGEIWEQKLVKVSSLIGLWERYGNHHR